MKYNLNESLYIAEVDKRKVYYHPFNKNKIIKIDKINNDDYFIESEYIKYLKNNNIIIPKYFVECKETIETNLGKEYIYPYINGITLKDIKYINEQALNNIQLFLNEAEHNRYFLYYCLDPKNIIIDTNNNIYLIDDIGCYPDDIQYLINNKKILYKHIEKIKRYIRLFKTKREI